MVKNTTVLNSLNVIQILLIHQKCFYWSFIICCSLVILLVVFSTFSYLLYYVFFYLFIYQQSFHYLINNYGRREWIGRWYSVIGDWLVVSKKAERKRRKLDSSTYYGVLLLSLVFVVKVVSFATLLVVSGNSGHRLG